MANPPKDDGRTVRALAGDADGSIAAAKQALVNSLGATDPVIYLRAIKAALTELEAAHIAVKSISEICEVNAVRGSYGKSE